MEKFRDIVYERPFLNTVRKQAAAWLNEFKKAGSFKETEETSSSKFNIMISPSGFILDVIKHKK